MSFIDISFANLFNPPYKKTSSQPLEKLKFESSQHFTPRKKNYNSYQATKATLQVNE